VLASLLRELAGMTVELFNESGSSSLRRMMRAAV
jgi:hypothetical protein